ncbi:MAG: NAD(P)-dependent alcohol dehydrogenase [Elusimicrobia bacterium]|nr:NAD(P)-dependent alcohol dehydrogenase [Elusimicrobiota bacterium]
MLTAIAVRGRAAHKAGAALEPFSFQRREPGEKDVVIDILFCGICHSDVHQARDEWGGASFPMVPGHEIVGKVSRVGSRVTRFKPGEAAGVGCFVDSCRTCPSCKEGLQQFCEGKLVFTYNSAYPDGSPTYGGYAERIVVDEDYAYKIAAGLPLDRVAPLLCAGITTYSPLRRWKAGKGTKVGVLGLGGLGHMAVQLAASMGAEVTLLSSSRAKEADAKRLGAAEFACTSDPRAVSLHARRFDLMIDTVSAPHPINDYLGCLARDGTMVLVGAPAEPLEVGAHALVLKRRQLAGSLIGGLAETQEMLDYCASHKIGAEVEVIPASKIDEAFDRIVKGDVRYRFVVDAGTI